MCFLDDFVLRWNLIIHGGIDGHTRLIVYLKCSNNNLFSSGFRKQWNVMVDQVVSVLIVEVKISVLLNIILCLCIPSVDQVEEAS